MKNSAPSKDARLHQLGDVLRADDNRLAVLLERMISNTADAADRAELDRLASQSPEIRLMVAACTPEAAQEDEKRVLETWADRPPKSSSSEQRPVDVPMAQVIPLRRAWVRTVPGGIAVAGMVAIAAALLVFVFLPESISLPPYSLEFSTRQTELRGTVPNLSETSSIQVGQTDVLTLTLRPETSHTHAIRGAAFVVSPGVSGGSLTLVSAAVPQGENGVLSFSVPASKLPSASPFTLYVVVAPDDQWTNLDAVEAALASNPTAPWQRWLISIVRTPAP